MIKMKILLFVIIVITVLKADELQEFQNSNLLFASDVYKKIAERRDGNFLVCTLSAQVILSLATVGARENTAKQLCNVLHLPEDLNKIQNIFEKIKQSLEVKQPYQFISINKIFLNNQCSIKSEYKDAAINTFKAGIENIDFMDKEAAAYQINNWVENKTDNKIKNLISEDIIDPELVAILVNALYFQGHWLYPFGESPNYKENFYISKNKTVQVDAMTQRNDFNYYNNKELKAEFLELPFIGNDVTMTFVLPNARGGGITELEKHISKVLSPQPLQVVDAIITLPKFKMESRIKLKEVLISLGLTQPFLRGANFQGISVIPLHIDDVIQKTFVEINEIGVTAAAATEITLMMDSMPQVFFNANRPFIYFLKHNVSGVFFVGRFSEPEED